MSTTNKLKKANFYGASLTSMTMKYAATTTTRRNPPSESFPKMAAVVTAQESQPQTVKNEHHWAARALRAEALLAAQEVHRKEVKTLGYHQELKRERELSLLAKEYKEKHAALERLLILLLLLIGTLVILIIYLSTHHTCHSFSQRHRKDLGWWSAIGASHFTIPILSPFTSVVENESSIVGPKLIGSLAAIAACLVYLGFRRWLSAKLTNGNPSSSSSSTSSSSSLVSQTFFPTSRSINK